MSKRNSSVELLKLISLFILCFSHCLMSTGILFENATNNIILLIGTLMRCFGQIGNVIFIVCSSYFLIDSTRVKREKVINFILDAFFISIMFLIVFIVLRIDISSKDFIKSFLPITFQNNWFIGCYIMLYIIHSYLNKIIKSIAQKELLKINVFFIVLYSMIQFVLPQKFYFTNLVGFIEIYFIVAYVKLYLPSFRSNMGINFLLLIIAIIGNVILILITNCLGLNINLFSDKLLMWNNNLANPFYIIIGITLFNIFYKKTYCNSIINFLSSCSLLFYMIHENLLFRNYVRPLFFKDIPINYIIYKSVIVALILFIISMIIALIYKITIQKISIKFSKYVDLKCTYLYKKLENILICMK